MGEATAQMAAADPGTGILAVDVHTPGQGNLLDLAERNGLTNIRVANGDAIILLREMLAPDSLDGLRVYFPDPWPKKRHHKRRLIQPEFLDLAATRLQPGRARALRDRLGAVRRADARGAHRAPGLREHPGRRRLRAASRLPAADPFRGPGPGQGHVVHDLLFRRVQQRGSAATA